MENFENEISNYVDHYFLKHSHTRKSHSSSSCPTCTTIASEKCPKHAKEPLNRNDIDFLELMNPAMTPERYMETITTLYKKEQALRSR